MHETARKALIRLNLRFYRRHASSFSATRQSPWSGWTRIVDRLLQTERASLRVLDLGCGNGRLGEYLLRRSSAENAVASTNIEYLGVDSSSALLAVAGKRLSILQSDLALQGRQIGVSLAEVDVTVPSLPHHLRPRQFEFAALFGVFHHIPGRHERLRLVQRTASLLAPGGLLAVSIWRLDQRPNFLNKVIPWEEYDIHLPRCLARSDLEEGDFLLSWAGDRETPRYCHFATDEEISDLISNIAHSGLDQFSADGKDGASNLYLVFEKHGSHGGKTV